MDHDSGAQSMTEIIAKFIALVSKALPDDVENRLAELAAQEKDHLSALIYDTMIKNRTLAAKNDAPVSNDTGILQFWIKCGANFPLLGPLEKILTSAAEQATKATPLRLNAVNTFDERNTGSNTGAGIPAFFWEIIPESDNLELTVYLADGDSLLCEKAVMFSPAEGYEGIVRFVLDTAVDHGVNCGPPLVVGVGVGASIETAARLSKKALLRTLGSASTNDRAAKMERLIKEGLGKTGLGPQGFSGGFSVLGVQVEHEARHPSAIGVAVSLGCWSHRRGSIAFDSQLQHTITTHKEAVL